jgi:hypothetical protein
MEEEHIDILEQLKEALDVWPDTKLNFLITEAIKEIENLRDALEIMNKEFDETWSDEWKN